MSNWVTYKNGNYNVFIDLENGTKIRMNDKDKLIPSHPESMDIKICNKCNMNCSMCHENSTADGACGDILGAKFIDTLLPYTELAIGGGNPLEHPDLVKFLEKCKTLKLIPSMTVHQKHFMENIDLLKQLRDEKLIYGIGVSISYVTDELVAALQEFPNAVCHIIAGIATKELIDSMKNHNLKVLLLGYKKFRRGEHLYKTESEKIDALINYMSDILPIMIKEGWFNTVSFDNLAITQLNPKRFMTDKQWEEFYMGDDGSHTLYLDLVNNEFATSSTSTKRHKLMDNIQDMFRIVAEESGHEVIS